MRSVRDRWGVRTVAGLLLTGLVCLFGHAAIAQEIVSQTQSDAMHAVQIMRWRILAGTLLLLLLIGVAFVASLRRMVRRRTAELQSIFDHMQEVLYRTDAKGRILMVTPSVTALTGYAPKEIRGRRVEEFYVDGDERAELLRIYEHYGRLTDYRIRLRHKDGRVLHVSVNSHVYRGEQGEVAGVEGTFRDVSELSEAEERLQTLALAVKNSPTSIIITDHHGAIIHVNPAFERISGYGEAEVLGKNPRIQSSGMTPPDVYRDMWQTILSGRTWRGEFFNRRKNGDIYCQASAIAPVRDQQGRIRFFVGVQEDISEQKRVAEALEKARQQADAANSAKSRFLAAASHDLRQPLQAMGLYLDVLAGQLQASDQNAIVGKLKRAHRDIGGLLDRLLDMTRLDAGEMQPKMEMFDLAGLLRELHEQYMGAAGQAGLVLRLRVASGSLLVNSDPVFVREIVSNLISNAIRHTQHGGVLLAARRCGGAVRIQIWDTGPGIEPDRQAAVFQEFVQLGNPERDRRKGLGLGLSIASRMGRLLGSRICLHSRPGRGSVFSFDLSLLPDGISLVKKQGGAPVTWDFTGRLVFLIDDDPLICDSLGLILQQWQCEVMSFGDGKAALDAARRTGRAPDAVIADYRLRDNATGVETIRGLHTLIGQAIPALLLTGDTEPSRMQEALAAGFPLLHKPVEAHRLGLFLERHWSGEGPAGPSLPTTG